MTTSHRVRACSICAAVSLLGGIALAQTQGKAIVYPAKGQSQEQQAKDIGECHAWAVKETGIDPAAPPKPAAAQQPAQEQKASSGAQGQRLRSAARGAAAGAVIGEVANNDADEGAAVGAVAGALAGGRQARQQKKAAQQTAQQEQEKAKQEAEAAWASQVDTFNRGNAACLEARGYVVK